MSDVPGSFHSICAVLDEHYPNPRVPLAYKDAYTLLVAVILSAQCTDVRVNQVTPVLWETFGSAPADIASRSVGEVLDIIRPCGLGPRKASSIVELSKILCSQYNGLVPSERKSLEKLPGVGRKTANVILSHIFGEPAFAVDTHVFRLSHRWGWSDGKDPAAVERDLCNLFPPSEWTRRHLQMIWFGREFCVARQHDASQCPACSLLNNPVTLSRP